MGKSIYLGSLISIIGVINLIIMKEIYSALFIKIRFVFVLLGLFAFQINGVTQTLPPFQAEQDACSALQICGNFFTPYSYDGVGYSNDLITTPCSSGEANSVWFRLEVGTAGIIVFSIFPIDSLDDYDFAVVDITNGNCNNIQQSEVIRCNFNNNSQPNPYYNGGIIGLNTTSTLNFAPAGANGQAFLQQINANAGDIYLIMVNNFGHDDCYGTCPGAGFTLDFTGSTATFNEPPPANFGYIEPTCNYSDSITIKLTENVFCNSIATNGSDFYLSPSGTIDSARGIACSGVNGYTDEVTLYFSSPLTPGYYDVYAQVGTDNNTLIGICGTSLPLPNALHFFVGDDPIKMKHLDNQCQTMILELADSVLCNTIATNGSDFEVVGPSAVSVVAAEGLSCGANSSTKSVKVTFGQPIAVDGIYTLRAKVGSDGNTMINNCGRVVSVGDSLQFQINSYNGNLTALPDTNVCPGPITLRVVNTDPNVPNGGYNYTWTSLDNNFQSLSPRPTVQVDTGQNTFFVVTVDSNGCYLRDSLVVPVFEPPYPDFSTSMGLGCNGDTVHFINESVNGNTFIWDFGEMNLTDTNQNTSHVYAGAGTYTVTLTARNAYCESSITKVVSFADHPVVADFTLSADTICENTSVRFTDRSTVGTVAGQAPIYKWFIGEDSLVGIQNPDYLFREPGVYQVMMVVQNGVPCSDTMVKTVVVDSLPTLMIELSDSVICKGDLVQVSTQVSPQSSVQGMIWDFGDGNQPLHLGTSASHSYDAPGSYRISVNADFRVCPDTGQEAYVRVKDMPYLNLGSDTSLCLDGAPYEIGDLVNKNNPDAKWRWSTGDTVASIKIRKPGHYWAEVTIDFCSTRDEINVLKDCYLDIPNSFTPNGDGVNDYFIPRQLLSKGLSHFEMVIWNRWGQQVFETNNVTGRGWDGRYSGKDQPVGVYVYQIKAIYDNGRTENYQGNVTLLR